MTESTQQQQSNYRSDSAGELVKQASEQLSELVRSELRLARAELVEKGKQAGIAGGLYGGAGVVAFIALQAAAATSIIALALVLPAWASGLVITALLLVITSVLALLARKHASRAEPPVPRHALDGARADVREIKERSHR